MLLLALAACDQAPARQSTPGDRLEVAAEAAGLIADPQASLVGAWARDSDRVCIVPGSGDALRIGALVDYGEGQACAAAGTLEQSGDRVRITFGDCRFDARFDGERLAFPGELPVECARACTGRASLAALAVARQSTSASEAAMLKTPGGQVLCGD